MENEQLTAAQMLEKAKAKQNFEFTAVIEAVATTEHYHNNITIILDRDIAGYNRMNDIVIKNSFHKNTVELIKQVAKSVPEIRRAQAKALVTGKCVNPEVFLCLVGAKVKCVKEFHAKGTPNNSGTTYNKDTYVTQIVGIETHLDPAFAADIAQAINNPVAKVTAKPAEPDILEI